MSITGGLLVMEENMCMFLDTKVRGGNLIKELETDFEVSGEWWMWMILWSASEM
jgi:hypothetical protein